MFQAFSVIEREIHRAAVIVVVVKSARNSAYRSIHSLRGEMTVNKPTDTERGRLR